MQLAVRLSWVAITVIGLAWVAKARGTEPRDDHLRALAWQLEQEAPGWEDAFEARVAIALRLGECPVDTLLAGSHLDQALATARQCGTSEDVARARVALGDYAAAAAIAPAGTRVAAIARIALHDWAAAARDVEALGHVCLGARLRGFAGELVTAPGCEAGARPAAVAAAAMPVLDMVAWDERRCAPELAPAIARALDGEGERLAGVLRRCQLVDARAVLPLLPHVRTGRHELARALRLAWRWPEDPVAATEVARYQLAVARALGEDAQRWEEIVARQAALADPRVAGALAELDAP